MTIIRVNKLDAAGNVNRVLHPGLYLKESGRLAAVADGDVALLKMPIRREWRMALTAVRHSLALVEV